MDIPGIRSLDDVRREVEFAPPLRLAVLAPEDQEFMMAIKEAYRKGYILPTLIGREERMEKAAREAGFDIKHLPKIFEEDLQNIANKGLEMLFAGEVNIVSKGQMPTAYVYRSVIRHEARRNGKKIGVIALNEMPGWSKFLALTDTGVNIKPDWQAKLDVLHNALSFMNLLGCNTPRVMILTAVREISRDLVSHRDAEKIKNALRAEGSSCIVEVGNIVDLFDGKQAELPDIILVPCLDAGNIIGKLDFFLNAERRAIVMTSMGPVLIPSRADTAAHIVKEIALGVVVALRLEGD